MATFEELQNSWRSQPLSAAEDPTAMQERFVAKLQRQQRNVLLGNICVTAGFIAASCVIVWVYFSFRQGRTLFFSGSIAAILLLMAVYLWVLWRGVSFRRQLDVTDPEYVAHYQDILQWRRKTMTTYVLIYSLLLWASLMCYMYDLLAAATLPYKIGGPLITTVYIWGVYFISKRTKVKKKLKQLDELLDELKKMGE